MSASAGHFKEELQQSLDVSLPDDSRRDLEAHLETCEECRAEFECLRWVKEATAQNLEQAEPPPELIQRIRASLDEEDASPSSRHKDEVSEPTWNIRWWSAAALVLAAIGALLYSTLRTTEIPVAAIEDFELYRSGRIELEHFTSEGEELEQYFRDRGVAFQTRVLDLGMMNYRVVGGRVHDLAGRPSSLFVYEGGDGQSLMCRMFLGRVESLPETDDVRENDGIRFFIYKRDGFTAVFWQEGDVVCALVSDIDSEEVVALAFAKAMQV